MRIIFIVVLTFVPFLLGHVLPKGDVLNIVNVPWGSLYGVGWYVSGLVFGYGSSIAPVIGFVLWPLVTLFSSGIISARLYRLGRPARLISVALLLGTALLNIQPDQIDQHPYSEFPIFWKFYSQAG